MKNLINYINEALSVNGDFKPTRGTTNLAQFFTSYLRTKQNKDKKTYTYSLNNEKEMERLFKYAQSYNLELLKEYHIKTPKQLAVFMWDNAKLLTKFYDMSLIRNFNEKEMERKFKEFKKTSKYQKGVPFIIDEYDESLDGVDGYRIIVVYDKKDEFNPDTTFQYKLWGKRGNSEIEHEVNMHKMDWKEQLDESYYDARPIFAKNYVKKAKEHSHITTVEFF